MIKCRIRETGEIKELSFTDIKTGIDCTNDIVGNTGAFTDGTFAYNAAGEVYDVDSENFDWWKEYLTNLENDEEDIQSLFNDLGEKYDNEEFENIKTEFYDGIYDCDMDQEHEMKQELISATRREYL